MKLKATYLIICEGDSECAYVQEFNRFLNEHEIPVVLMTCNAHGGGFSTLRQICRTKKTRRNGRTFIFVDRDRYFRDDNSDGSLYEKEKGLLPPFLFQTWNFEDFLLLHFSSFLLNAWRQTASECGHLHHPLHSNDFTPIFNSFCINNNRELQFDLPYEKGDMPFAITSRHLTQLITNNASSYPHSDFATFIHSLLHSQVKASLIKKYGILDEK